MSLQITGQHIEMTEALRQFIEDGKGTPFCSQIVAY